MKKLIILLVGVLLLTSALAAGCLANLSPASSPSSSPSTSPSSKLEEAPWVLISLTDGNTNASVLPNTNVTATFSGGNVSGSGGCNRYSATYQLSGNTIKVSSVISTLMYCTGPAGVMTQETAYLGLLLNVTAYSVSANGLKLSNEGGTQLLLFRASDSSNSSG